MRAIYFSLESILNNESIKLRNKRKSSNKVELYTKREVK